MADGWSDTTRLGQTSQGGKIAFFAIQRKLATETKYRGDASLQGGKNATLLFGWV